MTRRLFFLFTALYSNAVEHIRRALKPEPASSPGTPGSHLIVTWMLFSNYDLFSNQFNRPLCVFCE